MDSPTLELLSALASMFESGKYSDLTVVCGNQRYPVHRALLATRSTFFEGACRHPFRESETGVIDLSEDDPEAVEHMVHYFYHLDYLHKPLSQRSSRSLSPRVSHRSTRRPTKKLNLADDPLLAMAAAAAGAVAPPTPSLEQSDDQDGLDAPAKHPDTPMEGQLEDDPFDYVFAEPKADAEQPHLVTHAKVYAIAEKYGIAGLKSLARKKFSNQIQAHINSQELPDAIQEAYESTVDTDRGLRDIVIQAFRAHPDLSLRKDVELAIRETPCLAFELFRMASGLPITA